jgi:hypothetical protein
MTEADNCNGIVKVMEKEKNSCGNIQLVIVIRKEASTQEVIQSWPKSMHL